MAIMLLYCHHCLPPHYLHAQYTHMHMTNTVSSFLVIDIGSTTAENALWLQPDPVGSTEIRGDLQEASQSEVFNRLQNLYIISCTSYVEAAYHRG